MEGVRGVATADDDLSGGGVAGGVEDDGEEGGHAGGRVVAGPTGEGGIGAEDFVGGRV